MWSRRPADDFQKEVEAHVAIEVDRLVADGMSPSDARAAATRKFGNTARAQERFYEARHVTWLDDLRRDIVHALRSLARSPGFTLAAVLTMSLGMAATTTLFSVANGVLLRPLPWADSDRLVRAIESRQGRPGRIPGTLLNGSYLAWAESPSTIEAIGGWRDGPTTLTGAGDATRIDVTTVTPSLFDVLKAAPLFGRTFKPAEGAIGQPGVVVLGFGLWQERFGGSRDVLGRIIQLDGRPHEIIGVMPQDFAFPNASARAWNAWQIPSVDGGNGILRGVILQAMARLKPGATPAQAAAEATARARGGLDAGAMAVALFGARGPIDISVVPALDALTNETKPAIVVLLAAVGLLLATATANVAGLQLARAAGKHRELAIRAAIGASATRLMRQILVESTVLGLIAGATGLAIASALVTVLPAIAPAVLPRIDDVAIDWRVLGFSFAVSLAASIGCALLPMLHTRRINVVGSIAEDSLAPVGGGLRTRTARTRSAIMATQVALACTLLIGAALLSRSLMALMAADRGYDTQNVLTARLPLSSAYPEEARIRLLETLMERLAAQPGIVDAAFGSALPFVSAGGFASFKIPSPHNPQDVTEVEVARRVVSAAYFPAMKLRVIAGRPLTDRDDATARPAIVVNRSFVERYLGNINLNSALPISLRDVGLQFLTQLSGVDIVGVIEDMRQEGVDAARQPEIFLSYKQVSRGLIGVAPLIAIRTADDPTRHAATLRSLLREQDPSLALDSIMTMEERVSASLSRPRIYALLLVGFAGFALLLVGLGLFGVLSYSFSQRSREIAVRTALGATVIDVVRLVLRQSAFVTFVGVLLGLVASSAASPQLSRLLYGVSTHDLVTFTVVPLLVCIVAAIASVVPARRVAKVDPVRALRG